MSHCTGSVSWNSSTSTTRKRARSRATAAGPDCGSASVVCRRVSRSSKLSRYALALAALDLAPHRRARSAAAGRPRCPAGLVSGTSTACPSRTTVWASDVASASDIGGIVGAVASPLAQVQVLDDLDGQVVEVLDQHGRGVDVAGGAEPGEHLLAELVGGRDGGRVERGERSHEPRCRSPTSLSSAVGEMGEQLVRRGPCGGRVGEPVAGRHQPFPDAVAQLLGGGASEGDDEQLVEPDDALGDVAGDEPGDRERLAGAGAGLEDGGAAGQLAEQVEAAR